MVMFHELALSSPLGLDRNRPSSIPRAGFRPNLHSLTTQCAPSNVAPGQWVTEQMIDTPWTSNFCHSGLLPEPDLRAHIQSRPTRIPPCSRCFASLSRPLRPSPSSNSL